MDKLRNLLPFRKQREQEEEIQERSDYFHKNGGLLMEDLIATFGPRYNLPIRSFTHQQLIRATNNFFEKVFADGSGAFYRGSLEGRPVLVKYSSSDINDRYTLDYVIYDIVVTSQMSHHKNVLPLIGCCLELRSPALVYDNALDHEFLYEMFKPWNNGNNGNVISWRNRISIAKDVSSVLIYLHKAFSTPIILRDLKMTRVVINRHGVAKLVGFEQSISLPPGEVKVSVDLVVFTWGYVDPEYYASSFVTEKTDVYGMGALMLALFAGQLYAVIESCAECGGDVDANRIPIGIPIGTCRHFIKDRHRFKEFIDPKIFEEDSRNEDQILDHLVALSTLALRCTEKRGDDRPEMIDVAKQLSQIDKFVRS